MNKSAKTFTIFIERALQLGVVKKIDLHRKTGIGRGSIDGYLSGAIPSLEALDKIADALNEKSWRLIQPDTDKFPAEKIIPTEILDKIAKLSESDRELFFGNVELVLKAFQPEKKSRHNSA